MRITKKLFALLLCFSMLVQLCVPAFAAGGETNLYAEISATEVEVGDTFTLEVCNYDMTVSGMKAGFDFDNEKLEVTKISWKDIVAYSEEDEDDVENSPAIKPSKKDANTNGTALAPYAINKGVDSECYEGVIVAVTFKAIADGEAKITLREESVGTDAFKSDEVETITITIGGGEPACEHTNTKLVAKNDGTHNVVCAAEGCGHVVASNVKCSGTDDDNDCTTAVECKCGNVVTAAKDAHTPGTDDGDCTTAVKCANCDQIAIPAKGAHTPETDDDDCTTAIKCSVCGTVTTPAKDDHTPGEPVINEEASKDPTCTEEGTKVEETFCTECGKFISRTETPVDPLGHTWGDPTYSWDLYYGSCTAKRSCKAEGCEVFETETVNITESVTTTGNCQTEKVYVYNADFTVDWAVDQTSDPITGEKDMTIHTSTDFTYVDNKNGTHTKKHACCGAEVETVSHTYTDGVCVCEKVQTFTVTWIAGDMTVETETVEYGKTATKNPTVPAKEGYNGAWDQAATNVTSDLTIKAKYEAKEYTLTIQYGKQIDGVCEWAEETLSVPYGTKLIDLEFIKNLPAAFEVNWTYEVGRWIRSGTYAFGPHADDLSGEGTAEALTMPANNAYLDVEYYFTGWSNYGDGWTYEIESTTQKTGWTEINGSWYYLDPVTGIRAEGLTRVPYPTEKINGKTYAANAADVAIWEANQGTSKYTDAETAVFVFGTDGKFQQITGLVDGGKRYAKDGMVAWHPGMVKVDGEYYYFVGDKLGGGNIAAEGDISVTRLNGIEGFEQNGIYNFKNGKLSGRTGIVDGKYYENSKLMRGKGLTKIGDKYIFVRSAGVLATGKYWVTSEKANGYCDPGMYDFGTDGYMVIAQDLSVNGIVDGVYYKNGMPYYAGLIEIDGDMYYINSSGKVITGAYYVTKVNDTGIAKGTKMVFGEDGKLIPAKNGIVDGKYYENDKLMKGAGVVELMDENGVTFYIYVKSNGQLATGIYWPTTRNDLLPRGAYDWGTDGKYYPSEG